MGVEGSCVSQQEWTSPRDTRSFFTHSLATTRVCDCLFRRNKETETDELEYKSEEGPVAVALPLWKKMHAK